MNLIHFGIFISVSLYVLAYALSYTPMRQRLAQAAEISGNISVLLGRSDSLSTGFLLISSVSDDLPDVTVYQAGNRAYCLFVCLFSCFVSVVFVFVL